MLFSNAKNSLIISTTERKVRIKL